MKLRVTFKDPDGPSECVRDAAALSLATITGLSENERDALLEKRTGQLRDSMRRWCEYGEYVTIEIDTEADTAIVIRP